MKQVKSTNLTTTYNDYSCTSQDINTLKANIKELNKISLRDNNLSHRQAWIIAVETTLLTSSQQESRNALKSR